MEYRTMEAPLVGDHLALDMLNTEARDDGAAFDFWTSADDVLAWLSRQNIAAKGMVNHQELLAQAHALRTLARRLIVRRQEGKSDTDADIAGLNRYLHASVSAPHLERDNEGHLKLTRTASGATVAALLGPLAEAVAQLLVEGDFALVRQCEHPDCILWFYDRTKAHKRRWCSMAVCGNRYKAAQFRQRASR
jgi:predicted RNA-binding Zn ribbon-like protein